MECVVQTWEDGDVYISFYGIKVHYYYNRDYVTVELNEELINDEDILNKRVEEFLKINFQSTIDFMREETKKELNRKLENL